MSSGLLLKVPVKLLPAKMSPDTPVVPSKKACSPATLAADTALLVTRLSAEVVGPGWLLDQI